MWIGWASSVKLCIAHSSTAPTATCSLMGSAHPSGLGVPSGLMVPSSAATGPSNPGKVEAASLSDTWRVLVVGPGLGGVGGREVDAGHAATEGLVGPEVAQADRPALQTGEVDDHVGALGRPHQQLAKPHRCG